MLWYFQAAVDVDGWNAFSRKCHSQAPFVLGAVAWTLRLLALTGHCTLVKHILHSHAPPYHQLQTTSTNCDQLQAFVGKTVC